MPAAVDVLLVLTSLLYTGGRGVRGGSELRYTIPEELPVGHVIADIVADARLAAHYPTEVVVGGALRFTLLTQPAMPVVVNESTGQLITSGRVDREAICSTTSGVTSSPPCRVRLDVAVHPVQYFRIVKVVLAEKQPTFLLWFLLFSNNKRSLNFPFLEHLHAGKIDIH